MNIHNQIQEAVKRYNEMDSAFWDSLFHLVDNPDKAEEFREQMRIHFESADSALEAAIKAAQREKALEEFQTRGPGEI